MRAEAAAVRATPVVGDAAGGGRAGVDLLEARHRPPIAVTLTGGGRVRVSGRELSLPGGVLFLPLQAAMEAGRLRVGKGALTGPRWRLSCWRPAAGHRERRAGARGTTTTCWSRSALRYGGQGSRG